MPIYFRRRSLPLLHPLQNLPLSNLIRRSLSSASPALSLQPVSLSLPFSFIFLNPFEGFKGFSFETLSQFGATILLKLFVELIGIQVYSCFCLFDCALVAILVFMDERGFEGVAT